MGTTDRGVQNQGPSRGNGPIVQPGNAQENEALMRKMFNALNERSVSKMLPFMADDVTVVNIPVGRIHQGHAGYGEYLNTYIAAFPDYRLELKTASIPATGKRVELKFSESYDLVNGKVARLRSYWDTGSLMSQLGLTPS